MKVSDDKYYLKDSVIVKLEEDEAHFLKVDFKEEQIKVLTGEIYGFVNDEYGRAIKNANIHIMNEEHSSLMETFTDNDGNFLFVDVKPGVNYRIYVIAPNMRFENPLVMSIKELESREINFTLETEINMNFLSLKGIVKDKKSNKPMDGVVIYAFNIDKDNNETLKSIEKTNEKGEFLFWQIPSGNYIIKTIALGYKTRKDRKFVNGRNSEIEIFMELDKDKYILKGTIYGIIKDSDGNPIPNADVILCEVIDDLLVPIKFTKSDDEGIYLFENVDDGNYKIKASKIIEQQI